MEKFVCSICKKEFKSLIGLSKHYSTTHKLSREEIYQIYHPNEPEHVCKNCGKPTTLKQEVLKYNEFCCSKCAVEFQWKNKSEEDKLKRSNNLKEIHKNKSEEDKLLENNKRSETMKSLWGSKSEKDKLEFSNTRKGIWSGRSKEDKDKIFNKVKNTWKNKSEEELKNFSNKRKLYYENLTEEQKKNFSEKLSKNIKLAKNNETEESKIQRFLKISNSKKVYWDNISKERKEKIRRNKIEEYKNRPEEKKISRNTNIKSSWMNKSERELLNFSSKLKSSWVAKSELEKIKFINYHRKEELSSEQYQTLNNKDKFKQYLIEYKNNNGGYPTPDILKEHFKFSNTSGVLLYIHQYNLEDYILWNKSLYEQEVYDYIRSIYSGEILRCNRKVLNGKELDIYIPKKNLAIEFDGCYWHSKLWKDNHYHQNKSKECLSKNIRLIHIYEDEWIYKQDIVKDIIKSALGVFENKIYARDCIIKKVDKQTYKNMCQYHLQGYSPAQIILGLYYQDQLIQLASFSKSRYDKNYEYEWIRGVQLPGYQIIGGTSKLFKYFINNYNPESIICYSDFNKFSGNSYKNCGFTLDKITTPDMWFNEINGLKRINRQPSKHQLTKSLVESGDLLEMHGAGNMKWVWRK